MKKQAEGEDIMILSLMRQTERLSFRNKTPSKKQEYSTSQPAAKANYSNIVDENGVLNYEEEKEEQVIDAVDVYGLIDLPKEA